MRSFIKILGREVEVSFQRRVDHTTRRGRSDIGRDPDN
jgi:hypothetical protein